MPYTLLQVSKKDRDRVIVLAEFQEEKVAVKFAELIKHDDREKRYDYLVEKPVSKAGPSKPSHH